DLQYVPQRETGMTPYEIMLSESQERMLLVADKGREAEVFAVFHKWGLDAVTVGQVTADGILRVKDHGKVVAEIPNLALADEAPLYDRPHTKPPRLAPFEAPRMPDRSSPAALKADLIALLSSGDLCSKRWIWQQYDYLVRSSTLAGPTADAAIVRVKETGTSIAMSLDGNGRYCALDPREGTKLMVAECCRNVSVSGALPVAATNNLNFGNPERPEIMAQLVESIEGMAEACEFFETPITGGNVSLYNETLGEGIFPSPVMGIVGLMKTVQPTSIHFQEAGLELILLGGFGGCDETHFGGTQYAKVILDTMWGLPPKLDMDYEKRVQQAIREIVSSDLAAAAHDLSDGGLAIALCESSFGPAGIGARVEIPAGERPEFLLFHEGPSRVIVATREPEKVIEIARRFSVDAPRIGVTMKERLRIDYDSKNLLDCELTELRQPWETSLERLLHQQ
ncbi:MAG TPA: AIR synthase-related protein, partial [Bryobacteraceae bacterium]|nr:AIR synthase-related protein [Bryobacteraceae bacterium]